MSISISNYFQQKSIKLSDSFIAVVNNTENVRICGFTIPKITEWNEEVHKYGNVTQKILIPKIDYLPEVSIEVMEAYDSDGKNASLKSSKFYFGKNYGNQISIEESYSSTGYDTISVKYTNNANTLNSLDIYILNNDLTKAVYQYHFENLKLSKYEPYELSYQDESFVKLSLSFTFEKYTKDVCDKEVKELVK